MVIDPAAYQFDLVFDQNVYDENGNVIATLEGQKVTLDDSWDDLSPRFVVDYEIAPHVMVFGSLAKGYKAGGYNSVRSPPSSRTRTSGTSRAASRACSPTWTAGEHFGVLLRLQRQAGHLAGLERRWLGVPQYVVDTSDEEAFGIEVDARWQPLEAFTMTANLAFIDATYKDKVTRDGGRPVGRTDRRAALSAALGASYVWSLGNHGLLDLSAMHAYRGESRCNKESKAQGDCTISPNFEVGEATNRTDVRIGWTDYDDRWGVAAFVNNVFDNQYVDRRQQPDQGHVRHAVRVDLRAAEVGHRDAGNF